MKLRIQITGVGNLRTFNNALFTILLGLASLGLLISNMSFAQTTAEDAAVRMEDVDAAYKLIFQTQIGHHICRQILGANPHSIQWHIGVSLDTARVIAAECPLLLPFNAWVYPTASGDIAKFNERQPRKYKIHVSDISFPIESWTEPFTNTTVLVAQNNEIPKERLVQILAHELAVYFDAKANPAHPQARQIPQLRNLRFTTESAMNPMVAASNPLQAHALTFVRALQVESAIINDLVSKNLLKASALPDHSQADLIAQTCSHDCLEFLVTRLRNTLLPIGLPLLAFAPHSRALILDELPRMDLLWSPDLWSRARLVLYRLPVEFLQSLSTGDPVTDMKKVFFANLDQYKKSAEVAQFLTNDLWPLEQKALFESQILIEKDLENENHIEGELRESLLEYLKRPLLSGYNVALSSGPRVRIRTGVIE